MQIRFAITPDCTLAFALALASALAPVAATAMPANCSTASVPAGPVSGALANMNFHPDSVTLRISGSMTLGDDAFDTYMIKFTQGQDIFHQTTADITVLVRKGKKPDGRSFHAIPGDIDVQPKAAEGLPEMQGWGIESDDSDARVSSVSQERDSLQLNFGKRNGSRIPGTVYLCAPDGDTGWLGGSFSAQITD